MGVMKMIVMVMMMMIVLVGTTRGGRSIVPLVDPRLDCVNKCNDLCYSTEPENKNCVPQCIFFRCGPPTLPTKMKAPHTQEIRA
ncbi:unnamed protein product [Microthlaspi erraticum]|uniref:Knottin scorpion toxin-like domain-containing protein n=1 Tax=Microthlaspi erraticum TaxID=1685480 RepID=A0A6D2K261_9BRAS|nr:unnamed protein product [Microthlaspi erraticum]